MKKIIVGARASRLSVVQAEEVIRLLRKKSPEYIFFLKKITTAGDKIRHWQRNDVGIFVKELEEALLAKDIDIAVHSVKDLPSKIPPGLSLAAVTKREDPYDCLIFKTLPKLKKTAIVGTSSLRRAAQLLRWRPDLEIKGLRGNLDTRLRKLQDEDFDAIIVALAGIKRLGYKNLKLKPLAPGLMLPAAGQGALGIEIRKEDRKLEAIVQKINHQKSFLCVACERAFLREFGSGCRLPLGAWAEIKNRQLHLEVLVSSLDGKKIIRLNDNAPLGQGEFLGRLLAKKVLLKGGRQILDEANKHKK